MLKLPCLGQMTVAQVSLGHTSVESPAFWEPRTPFTSLLSAMGTHVFMHTISDSGCLRAESWLFLDFHKTDHSPRASVGVADIPTMSESSPERLTSKSHTVIAFLQSPCPFSPVPASGHLSGFSACLLPAPSLISPFTRASRIAQLVKNPPAMQETLVQFLGWEDPLEKG